MTLDELNHLPEQNALVWFEHCCVAKNWYQQMVEARPFDTVEHIENYARLIWDKLSEHDYLQAFEAHPMIGDVSSLKKKYAATATTAAHEQAGTKSASDAILTKLSILNRRYFEKNGFIFIVCATGLTALQMLEMLEARIDNTREQEIAIASQEQIKITLLRINKQLQQGQ